jgi:hypothetical protein
MKVKNDTSQHVAGTVYAIRLVGKERVEFKVSGKKGGATLEVNQSDPYLRDIKLRDRVLVAYEPIKENQVFLLGVKRDPTHEDILAISLR